MKKIIFYQEGRPIHEDTTVLLNSGNRYMVIPKKDETVVLPNNTTYTVLHVMYDYRTGIAAVSVVEKYKI